MLIPGQIISLVTFPGVIVHEAAHQLFCRICRVSVLDTCYFRYGNPCGYVVHEKPDKEYKSIIIGIGPFIVNTVLGALISMPAAIPVITFGTGSFEDYFLIWLGVSIAMHAFPSTGDAANMWQAVKSSDTSLILKLISAPIVALIYLGAIGSVIWLDYIYGIAISALIPTILINIFS